MCFIVHFYLPVNRIGPPCWFVKFKLSELLLICTLTYIVTVALDRVSFTP
jgi:hypothetical protein